MKPDKEIPKVKLIAGILFVKEQYLNKCLEFLEVDFGKIDFKSKVYLFTASDYYYSEMGKPMYRLFISFQRLITADLLADIKNQTNSIEDKLSIDGKRTVNIDPGYLDYDKIVLASVKYNGNKIYLKDGIWADLTLYYQKGKFSPYPWSFPDFKRGKYNNEFLQIRELFKKQMKN